MQDFSKITFVIIYELCECCLLFCTIFGRSTGRPGRPLADARFPIPLFDLIDCLSSLLCFIIIATDFSLFSRKIIEREEAVYQ